MPPPPNAPLSLALQIQFGKGEWVVGSVQYERKYEVPLYIIITAVVVPMLLIIGVSIFCYRQGPPSLCDPLLWRALCP